MYNKNKSPQLPYQKERIKTEPGETEKTSSQIVRDSIFFKIAEI